MSGFDGYLVRPFTIYSTSYVTNHRVVGLALNGLYCGTHKRIVAVTIFAHLYGQAAVPSAKQNILQDVARNCKLLSKIELYVGFQTKIGASTMLHCATKLT